MPASPDSLRRSDLDFFEVRPGDDYLFSSSLRGRLQEALKRSGDSSWDTQTYHAFLKMLAGDEDTPSDALLEIAKLLHEEYLPGVALRIIENPVVKKSRPILETLAELPGFDQSDIYRRVREQASALLSQL